MEAIDGYLRVLAKAADGGQTLTDLAALVDDLADVVLHGVRESEFDAVLSSLFSDGLVKFVRALPGDRERAKVHENIMKLIMDVMKLAKHRIGLYGPVIVNTALKVFRRDSGAALRASALNVISRLYELKLNMQLLPEDEAASLIDLLWKEFRATKTATGTCSLL